MWQGFAQSAEQAFAEMAAKYLVSKLQMFLIDAASYGLARRQLSREFGRRPR
jgi:hypothetical protein